jgi:hypothetical protein
VNTDLRIFMVFAALPQLIAQANYRPSMYFREVWKEIPAEIPLSQEHVDNQDLLVQLCGPEQDSLKRSIGSRFQRPDAR